MLTLVAIIRWLLQKLAAAVLIVALLLGGCGLWLFLRDKVDMEVWRKESLRLMTGEHVKLRSALADTHRELAAIGDSISAEQARLAQADKVIAGLKELDSTWDRYVADRDQQKIDDQRLASVSAQRDGIVRKLQQLNEDFTRKTWTRDGLQLALGRLDVERKAVEAKRSQLLHVVEQTWNYELGRGVLRLPLRWWVLILIGGYFAGPSLGKLGMYYGIAPWVVRGRPVRLSGASDAVPVIEASRVAVDLALGPEERLLVKENFLQASDEGLQRKTRYLLDWRIPLTCIATRLVELIEMANRSSAVQRVTLSNQGDAHCELAVITLPEGASLVLRPSFLAGIVTLHGQRPRLRRRWQLLRFQAWVTLQFRFFEFAGPCRLIVAGSRGVRAEHLGGPGAATPARRTNQDATVGFTPTLEYRPARAETFWSYYRGANPLFDDLFAGNGVFVCQQVASAGEAREARNFWASVWGGLARLLGL